MHPKMKERLMMTLSMTVAIYRHSDSQRYAALGSLGSTSNQRLTRGQCIKCRVKFARQKRCPVGSTGHVAVHSWHGTDSHPTVAPFQWTHLSSTTIAASRKSRLYSKKMCLSEVRILPNQPKIASALWNNSRVLIPKDAVPSLRLKRTSVQSLLLQISSTVHWHKQTTVHSWLKVHPRQT